MIQAPETFFQTFQEGLNKNSDEIIKYYERISSSSNFLLPSIFSKDKNPLSIKMQEITKAARQTILLYMSLQPEYSLLNIESLSAIYKNSKENPQTLFNEPFKFVFGKIIFNPVLFSRIIRNYFSQTDSNFFLFCWSTFPSVYNFFTSDIHLEYGYDLIMQFFSSFKPLDIKISNSLLEPYFLCAFNFLSKFWMKVSTGISRHSNKKDIFEFMIECISSCSVFLSFYHKSIIQNLYNITPNRCLTFLFNNFLKPSFEIIIKNDQFLFTPNEIGLINKFIETYSKSTITPTGKKIIQAFTFQNKKKKKNENEISISAPLTPDFESLGQIKSIISYYDVAIMSEFIIFSENEFKNICNVNHFKIKINENYKKGFIPVFISNTNPNRNKQKEEDLFPKDYQGYWSSIVKLASERNADPIQFYIKNIQTQNFKFDSSSNELLLANFHDENKNKFVYLNQIHLFEEKYKILNRYLNIQTRINENDVLLNSINSIKCALICECCEKMKNKALSNFIASGKVLSNKIGGSISNAIDIISAENEMKEIPSFDKLVAILNSFEIEMDDRCMSLIDCFLNLIDVEKNNIQNSMLQYRKAKRILNSLCNRFLKIFEWELFGKKFGAIIKLVEYVSIIDKNINREKSNFNLFFTYVLCVLNNHIFFDAYLIMKMVMIINNNLLSFFDKQNKNNYLIFDNVMKEFLGAYKIEIRCLTYIQSCIQI